VAGGSLSGTIDQIASWARSAADGRGLAGLAFRGILLAGSERQFPPGDLCVGRDHCGHPTGNGSGCHYGNVVEFLGDYLIVFPAVAAVTNGALAVFLANFPRKTARAKFWFTAVIVIFSIAAISITFYAQSRVISERAAEKTARAEIRAQLADFITEGNRLMEIYADNQDPMPNDIIGTWSGRVASYLSQKLGAPYGARFNNWAGIPPMTPGTSADDNHRRKWLDIYNRVVRLEQFSQEYRP
jgi:hypothetical protein